MTPPLRVLLALPANSRSSLASSTTRAGCCSHRARNWELSTLPGEDARGPRTPLAGHGPTAHPRGRRASLWAPGGRRGAPTGEGLRPALSSVLGLSGLGTSLQRAGP